MFHGMYMYATKRILMQNENCVNYCSSVCYKGVTNKINPFNII